MSKKLYTTPMLLGPINPVTPTTVPYGPSQGEYDDKTSKSPADMLPDPEPEEEEES